MNTRLMRALVIVSLSALILLGLYIVSPVPPDPTASPDIHEQFWKERIRAVGGPAAYKEFSGYAHRAEKKHESIGHVLAHRFGASLYEEMGVDGVSVCDTSFSFGCLHEWFKRAVAEYGAAPLEKMVEACKEAIGIWHPCQHAIGHGILANAGYTRASLDEALALCKEYYNDDPMNGCLGGVFMEYNLYTTQTLRVDPRPVEPGGWYAPCTGLSEAYKRSCYYWLPQWWHEFLRLEPSPLSVDERFLKMGELCRALPDQWFVRECFQRVGQLVVHGARFEPSQVIRLCDALSTSQEEKLLCRSYAAYIFSNTVEKGLQKAYKTCEGLSGESKDFCESYARKEFFTPNDRALPTSL